MRTTARMQESGATHRTGSAPRFTVPLLAATWCLGGCTGSVGGPPAGPSTFSDPAGPSTFSDDVASLTCSDEELFGDLVGEAPRRLTRFEVQHTLDDLFGVEVSAESLPLDFKTGNFYANRGAGQDSGGVELGFEAMQGASEQAAAVVAEELGCSVDESGCAAALVDGWGPLLYRRPLTTEERSRLIDFAETNAEVEGAEVALQMTLHVMLASPQFNYVIESGQSADRSRLQPASDEQKGEGTEQGNGLQAHRDGSGRRRTPRA